MRVHTVLLVSLIAVTGCKKVVRTSSSEDLEVRAVARNDAPAEVPRADLDALLASFRRVHFDTDSAVLDADDLATLRTSAALLLEHPTVVVDIEGHADERGTFDYNLALGAARAEAVRKTLVAFGVTPSRLRTNTWGEEKPAVDGHDEVAWAENRRAEFRVRVVDGSL